MNRILLTVALGGLAVLGAILIFWSADLSMRYNAWTATIRERDARFSPPPTPQSHGANTRIMKGLFRIAGAVLILFSALVIALAWDAN